VSVVGSKEEKFNPTVPQKTVLVVEDDTIILRVVRTGLHRQGCRVLTAKSVPEAEEKWAMAHGIIDLVVSDNKLGYDRGIDLVQRFQQQKPGAKFILCSGEPIDQEVPGVPFLKKPFSLDSILNNKIGEK